MKLILFFNGWGMDESVVRNIEVPKNYRLKVINFPYEVDSDIFFKYSEVIWVGWSFGSYYLAKYLLENEMWFENVISINGVPETIGDYGIPIKIFYNTLENLTPEKLIEFYSNMEASIEFSPSNKSFKEIREELQYFSDNYKALRNVFTKAFIGRKDKIIPALRQKRYYTEAGIPIEFLKCGHYPFGIIKSWKEIIGDN